MNIRRIFFLNFMVSVLFILFSALISCKSSTEANNNDNQTVYPDSGLSFSQHIRPIFIQDCATIGGCHQTATQAGGLDLETDPPSFLADHGLVVIAFSSTSSNLYLVLFDQLPGVSRRMPPPNVSVSGLEDAKIKAIGTWISEGANTAN